MTFSRNFSVYTTQKSLFSLILASVSKFTFGDDLGKRRFRTVNDDVPITC